MELVDSQQPFPPRLGRRAADPTASRLRATACGRYLEEPETGCRITGAELARVAAGWEAELRAQLDEADGWLRERKASMADATTLAVFAYWRDWHVARIEALRKWVRAQRAKLGGGRRNDGPRVDWARARAYPIRDLVEVSRGGFARCPAHAERTASMKVYNDNHAHCFGCGFHGSAVDVAAALWNVTPLEAARRLSN